MVDVLHLPRIEGDELRIATDSSQRYAKAVFAARIDSDSGALPVINEDFDNATVNEHAKFYWRRDIFEKNGRDFGRAGQNSGVR